MQNACIYVGVGGLIGGSAKDILVLFWGWEFLFGL